MEWYEVAAEKGHKEAYVGLGKIYLSDDGVKKSRVRAYGFFSIGAAMGSEQAFELMENLLEELDSFNLKKGHKFARRWINENTDFEYLVQD